jgi:dTDP-4-amino-4,6-dideoxygalactose transaminase
MQAHLRERGISSGIHYPIPIHLQKAYEGQGFSQGQFPVTEQLCPTLLSLPMYPELTDEQVRYVAGQVTVS